MDSTFTIFGGVTVFYPRGRRKDTVVSLWPESLQELIVKAKVMDQKVFFPKIKC